MLCFVSSATQPTLVTSAVGCTANSNSHSAFWEHVGFVGRMLRCAADAVVLLGVRCAGMFGLEHGRVIVFTVAVK